jgi:hypothetical protein
VKKGKQTSRHLVSSTEPFSAGRTSRHFPSFRPSGPVKQAAARTTGPRRALPGWPKRPHAPFPRRACRSKGSARNGDRSSLVEAGRRPETTRAKPRGSVLGPPPPREARRPSPEAFNRSQGSVVRDLNAVEPHSRDEMNRPVRRVHGGDAPGRASDGGAKDVGRAAGSKVRPAWLTVIRQSGARP